MKIQPAATTSVDITSKLEEQSSPIQAARAQEKKTANHGRLFWSSCGAPHIAMQNGLPRSVSSADLAKRWGDAGKSGRDQRATPRHPWCAVQQDWARRIAARAYLRSAPRGRRSWRSRPEAR